MNRSVIRNFPLTLPAASLAVTILHKWLFVSYWAAFFIFSYAEGLSLLITLKYSSNIFFSSFNELVFSNRSYKDSNSGIATCGIVYTSSLQESGSYPNHSFFVGARRKTWFTVWVYAESDMPVLLLKSPTPIRTWVRLLVQTARNPSYSLPNQ